MRSFKATEFFTLEGRTICTVQIDPPRPKRDLILLVGRRIEIDGRHYTVESVGTYAVPDDVSVNMAAMYVTGPI